VAPTDDEAGVQGTVENRLFYDIRSRGRDVELDVGVPLLVAPEDGRDRQVPVGNERIDDAHIEGSAQLEVDAADIRLEAVEIGDELKAQGIDLPAEIGQGKAAAPAPTQPHAEPGFQILDVSADRRQPQLQFLFRRGEAAATRHGAEHAQQADVAVAYLAVEASRIQPHGFDPGQSSLRNLIFLRRPMAGMIRRASARMSAA